MNMRNKMIAWVAGVVTVVVVLIVVIVSLEPPGTRISRAQAFKAMGSGADHQGRTARPGGGEGDFLFFRKRKK